MIKVANPRVAGSLFHYAHFICDCLFPEIIQKIYQYDTVIRLKTVQQTLGNFHAIYTDVMQTKHVELDTGEYDNVPCNTLAYNTKETLIDIRHFHAFRRYIFNRYPQQSEDTFPDVILIKRGARIELIDDPVLKQLNTNITTGKERREIDRIDEVQQHLEGLYGARFQAISLESMPFPKQVAYFNHARLIVCAHGAGMANLFFCKEGATVVEVTCNKSWPFFDKITGMLHIRHIKCPTNTLDAVIHAIPSNL